ncbi:hypothetical protein [Pseudomonas aeruginosa]|jgi:hypothetical protein|uniref:hypothetical protein n=1 Tax=Pseudomonas aeruginosa TaxID=287 RepID=UPI002D7B1018|nr:hypothetical protein [Pseudomonas aeruginosa]HCL3396780.1 hypothetical protein [Pseudomonas aeruginosa]HEQ2037063.1 hypothetical protein [Pseudomonas aeruginosa]
MNDGKDFDFNEFKKEFKKENVLTVAEILEFSKEEFFTSYEKEYLNNVMGDYSLLVNEEEIPYLVKGEVFEFSGEDLIEAEIDENTLRFKK